ncbi:MAG: hypothetical protein GXP29_11835 [Planctomycetes bacterium]|nr:hypothetical protein [Planctomycetota bacterium]
MDISPPPASDPAIGTTIESSGAVRRHLLSPFRVIDWLSSKLASHHTPLYAAILTVILTLPGLWLGWQTDDHLHRATLTDEFPRLADARRPFPDLFAFVKDGLVAEGSVIDRGELPWWSPPNLRLAFFRPVAGLSHWIDYQLWPHTPALMHAQSIAWYALTVALAALLFRRFSVSPYAAGLAALIYTMSDGHGLPAVWLANRNAVLAACFGICTILLYDRWRRDGSRLGAFLAPITLLAAVLSNEGAVAVGAYLLAYALFIDVDRTWRRFAALVPSIVVGVAWWSMYKLGGYGAVGSGVYIDPAGDPGRFMLSFVERAPILFNGLFSIPPSDAHIILSQPAVRILWIVGICIFGLIVWYAMPHIRSDKYIRFATFGMILSIVPACATFASDRLLMLAGLGASLIVAQLIVGVWRPIALVPQLRGARYVAGVLVVIHLILAPIGLLTAAHNVRGFGTHFEQAGLNLPNDDRIDGQRLVIVSTPSAFVSSFASIYAATLHRNVPQKSLVLGSGVYEVTVERTDERTLVVSQAGGWLLLPGRWPTDAPDQFKWVSFQYLFQTFDALFRDDQPFMAGERIELSDCTIEIVEITTDHRPATVCFRFDKPLEDEALRWVYWKTDRFSPFDLPNVGETVTLPAPRPSSP